ncbi:hypothetical protein [Tritonibacter mobilis]|uniref:hypothetical protein n=1 Tax=Tritonibacter mobilis TaxID=379347 RepID=UPI0008068888|nr:hypothetical protein [Tritonibacter mobilis]
MPNAIDLDPARGFVALPASLMNLDISPGAFRALTVLCNLANREGYSWASLEQLGEWIRRAKSSVSAYLTELRDADLIETENQTRRNGANYRLKIRVTFWSAWVKVRNERPSPSPQKTERRVQQAERPTKVKNKSIKTPDSRPQAGGREMEIFKGWQALTKGVPFGQFARPAPETLVRETEALLRDHEPQSELPQSEVTDRLAETWEKLGVPCPAPVLRQQAITCGRVTADTLDHLARLISETWQTHWRKPPTPKQFGELISTARAMAPTDRIVGIIACDYRRYKIATARK